MGGGEGKERTLTHSPNPQNSNQYNTRTWDKGGRDIGHMGHGQGKAGEERAWDGTRRWGRCDGGVV